MLSHSVHKQSSICLMIITHGTIACIVSMLSLPHSRVTAAVATKVIDINNKYIPVATIKTH